MFNQSGFNALPFNRSISVDVTASFEMDLSGEMIFVGSVDVRSSFEMDITLNQTFNAYRDQIGEFVMDLLSDMEFEGTRDRLGTFDMNMKLDMDFNAARFQVLSLTFTGEFKPGDKIIIDSSKLKLTKNGQNALQDMQGDFISLFVGNNRLTWTDDQTTREVLIRLQYRDRYM